MRIARLIVSEVPSYRDLMLEAFANEPDAFVSTAEERAGEPLSWWEERVASTAGLTESFGAFAGPLLVGTVTIEYSIKPKTRHAALVIGMYVRPAQRGSGAARALMKVAIAAAAARPEIQRLRLTVTEGNQRALHLYKSVGFVAWGTEPEAILTATGLKGKVHMSLAVPNAEAVATPDLAAEMLLLQRR